MNKLKTILLGTDFSLCATAALHQAARLARWNNAKLHTLHVANVLAVREYDDVFRVPLMSVEKEPSEYAGERLKQWLLPVGISDGSEAVIGMPLETLLNRIKELDANLLVLGLRGETTLQNDAGNLALKCLRKAQTKVMLVHERHAGPFRNVVCCVDFSETSREAVEQVRRVGQQDQSQVHFIHLFSVPWRGLPFHLENEESIHEHDTQYRAMIENRLKEFVGDVSGLRAGFKVIECEGVSHGISEFAQQTSADLIVLGNKGQSTFKAMLLGSTVERLLRELPCSVLVVRPSPESAAEIGANQSRREPRPDFPASETKSP